MEQRDWKVLCESISRSNCILFLGPEFPIQIKKGKRTKQTSISNEIAACIKSELSLPLSPVNVKPDNLQLSELANYYYARGFTQPDMSVLIDNWYKENADKISLPVFDALMKLPFTFLVDTTVLNLFYNHLKKLTKKPEKSAYQLNGKAQPLTEPTLSVDDSIGTVEKPFVYNLYGTLDEFESMAISENELINLLISIISKNPRLPLNITTEFEKSNKIFLFVGFGILSKSWYFKILLQVLGFNNKKLKSYSTDYTNIENYNSDPQVFFFDKNLHVKLCALNSDRFVKLLCNQFTKVIGDPNDNKALITTSTLLPKVFISYVKEDLDAIKKIRSAMNRNNVDVWWDENDLRGLVDINIKNIINYEVAGFVVVISKNLLARDRTYVFREIEWANETASLLDRKDDFIYTCLIDDIDRSEYESKEKLKDFSPYKLHGNDFEKGTLQLCTAILRNYRRHKKLNT